MKPIDVIIIGAGAAGLMCAIEAGKRGKKVLVLDAANKVGKKILMSGGGRCNFTNYHISPESYQSHNPHFCKSALSRYTQWDFIELVKKHKIAYYEKTLGQLFCVNKSQEIVNMLLAECEQARVKIQLNTHIQHIKKLPSSNFEVKTKNTAYACNALVIAAGGLSIPTLGASPFAYHVAEQFGLPVYPTRAGLVPFTLNPEDKEKLSTLSGIGLPSVVSNQKANFKEALLFTHRGFSGPAILQLSSYWSPGETITINLLPEYNLLDMLQKARIETPKKQLNSILSAHLPKRVIDVFIPMQYAEKKLGDLSNPTLDNITSLIQNWQVKPDGTEGYRTAEVTLGGIDCNAISSKTMEAQNVPGLYFIGEALDITGLLGGYNFQWAWSSGFAAGQSV
ncbi:MAG: NAD(P)/FAD-dependent oxidoreductase [Gammaproteobacteria bacterium]|nr:NAD(P)/FAD-dependent oxidoreductase [Gammaproteobacteria bacterium]MCH9763722.1 NAD(P)/FAD-dependent oxidoreductase [Gammaproteobacteria bacterium]